MKRVLEVFGEPISRGGQESYVMTALQHMDLSGLHVDLFTPYYCDNQEYTKFIEAKNGKVVVGNNPFIVGGTRREVIPVFENYLGNNKYDIVHIHSGSISILAYYARVASKKGVKKVIVHSHSSGQKENIKHFLMKKYASKMFEKYATDFCACSKKAAEWKFPNSVLDRVKILNNGVDLKKFEYDPIMRKLMRKSLGIDDKTLVLGHVGRFTYEKNQIFLIEILKKYIEHFRDSRVLLMLVGDGVEIDNVKKRTAQLNLSNHVKFVGATNVVNEYLQAMDIFLFPSLYEGLGIAGIEAQASGLPVIASTGIPTAMNVCRNVVFLDLTDASIWVDAISKCKNEERTNNFEYLKERGYDIKDSAQSVQNLYIES